MPVNNLYYNKYLKYKNKYLNLQSQIGGVNPLRQQSLYISNQGRHGTCFAHGTTRLIMKLITTFFNEPSLLGNRDCHYYYNTEICNIDNNIFDCFLQIKKGETNCKSLPDDGEVEKWPEENFYALLFHFIFSTVVEQFGLDGGNPITSCLYILDYLKHFDISKKKIKDILKYNEEDYETDDIDHFNKLINDSVELFKDVKKNLNNKIFNPIIYIVDNDNMPIKPINVQSISKYQYHTKYFECTKNDWKEIKTKTISFIDKIIEQIPFSNIIEQLDPTYTTDYNLKEFTNSTNLPENIKYVLDHNYYALLTIKDHVITITHCSGNKDDLILEVKNSHGLEDQLSCTGVSRWCNLINNNKIKVNDLLKWTEDYWTILFFYPYEFIEQKKIINDFNKNTSLKYPKKQISNDEGIAIARVLMQNTTLKSLSINECKIDDDVTKAIAAALEKNKTLTILNLSDNKIGNKGAEEIGKALKKNNTLTTLNLSDNKIGIKGTEEIGLALYKNSTLSTLNLRNNEIGNYGAEEIVRALGEKSTLTTLNLDSNFIKNTGAKAIADALKKNKTLKEIELSYNDIDDDGVKVIAEALKKNKDSAIEIISFNNNLRISSKIIEELNEKRIFFSQYTDEQKKIINDFERNTTTIFTSTKKISEAEGIAIAHALARNTTLLDLYLNNCNITDYVVKAIARALGQNNTLTELHLQGNNIGDDGAIAIGKALKINRTLTFIDLAYNNIGIRGTLAIAEALETNEIIELVDLAFNNIEDHTKYFQEQEKRILFK
jgi:Ran GTPase-activating protein (RanGAP) involved in mRNA processing and transport